MSVHDDFAERLADVVGEAGLAALPRDVEEHARACGECASLLEALRALATDASPVAEVPAGYWDGFEERLRARLEEPRGAGGTSRAQGGTPRARSGAWRLLAAAAGFVAVGLAGWLAWRGPQPAAPSVPAAALDAREAAQVLAAADANDVARALDAFASSGDDGLAAWSSAPAQASEATAGLDVLDDDMAGLGAWAATDVLGTLEDDLADLDEDAQRDLARRIEEALRS